jgi:hypothetical protein
MAKIAAAFLLLITVTGLALAQEERGEPEVLSGRLQPARVSELRLELKGYGGELKLKSLLAPGTSVVKGDIIAEVEAVEYAEALERAEENVALARGSVEHLEGILKHANESFAHQHERARRNAERAHQDLEHFRQHDRARRIRNSELSIEGQQHSIEDQEEELAQLERLYKGNDLAKESQDIVLNRSKRRLKNSRERLEMSKQDHKRLLEVDLKRREEDLTSAHQAAVLELERLNAEAERGNLDLQGKLTRARRGFKDAEKSLADLKGDAERFKLTAPHDGMVAVGGWAGNDGASNPFRIGDEVKNRTVLASVAGVATLSLDVNVRLDARANFQPGQAVKVTGKDGGGVGNGKVTAIGFIVNRAGMVTATVEVENAEGTFLPGQKVSVALP